MASGVAKLPRWVRSVVPLVAIVGLLFAVYLLPPDTSLAQIQKTGLLRVCVPTRYPPLVTGDERMPGMEIELLREISARMGLRLLVNTNSAMGQDFNPGNWRVTRAQCAILAGGVVVSDLTRSFLETTPPHLETGWAAIWPGGDRKLNGSTVGVLAVLSGFDRIALTGYLRAQGCRVVLIDSEARLAEALRTGEIDFGVTEALLASRVAGERGWSAAWLGSDLMRYPLAMGLWKGDLTLKRELTRLLGVLKGEGFTSRLAERYRVVPLNRTL